MPRKSHKARGATPNSSPAAELRQAEGLKVADAAAEALERLDVAPASDGDPQSPSPSPSPSEPVHEEAPAPPQSPLVEASSSGRSAAGRRWEEEAVRKLHELAEAGGDEVELTEEEVLANDQRQEDEIYALEAIFGDDVVILDSKGGQRSFQVLVHIDIPDSIDLSTKLNYGDRKLNYGATRDDDDLFNKFRVEHLPPILLTCLLPLSYPSHHPPFFTISTYWLDKGMISLLCRMLDKLSEEHQGMEVAYYWVQWLQRSSLSHLGFGTDKRACPDNAPPDVIIPRLMRHNENKHHEAFLHAIHDCMICFSKCLGVDFIKLPCHHFFCWKCMQTYCKMNVKEGNVVKLLCPDTKCEGAVPPNVLKRLLGEDKYERRERLLLERTLDAMQDVVYCPRCQTACLEEVGNEAVCSSCLFSFCTLCRNRRHIGEQCMSPEEKLMILEDQRKRVISLDDLIHDMSADPIKLPLAYLQKITMNFADKRKIGEGGFGIVYKGVLQTGRVAVKKLLNSQTIEDKTFQDEVDFLMGFRHENIIRFLGYCAHTEHTFLRTEGSGSRQKHIFCDERERLLCFEYMSNGDLNSHITDELRGFEWHTRYKIIKGICEGLQYLHNKGMAHMDLKPANVLLDDLMVPKITDFGTTRDLDGKTHYSTKQRLVSRGYCAPEYLLGGQVSLKADIFSLGVIIKDIVTGRKEDIDSKNVHRRWRYRWNKSDKYATLGYQQISKCIEIAQRCIVENPKSRPHISDIINAQNEIEKSNGHIANADESTVGQISPYPWELLEIDPLELKFLFKPKKLIQSSVILNNRRDDYIAFDIQKPRNPLKYSVEPNKGIVEPHSGCSVTVTFEASYRVPDGMFCKDSFEVRCAIVDDGLTAANISEDVFDTKSGKVVDEVMLTVAFT